MRGVILFVLILLTGCQGGHDKTVSALKIDFQEGDLPSLHPHALMIYLRGISTAKTLYECLTRIDERGVPQLAGAQSVDISPDRLAYTFHLRPNRWSDGSPVLAKHYENAWKEALSPTSNCSRADLLYMIKNAESAKKGQCPVSSIGVHAADDNTLVVELAYPSPYFLELAAQPICAPLVHPENKESALFNGPFVVDEWKKGDFLRLKPNPYYWDKAHVFLKEIDICLVQDAMTAFAMYEKKQLDWIGAPLCPLSSELIGQLEKANALQSHAVDRAFWVFLNTQHPALSSPSIRRALSLAVDRPAITQHILIGGRPLDKPLPAALLPQIPSQLLRKDLAEAQNLFAQGLSELGRTKENLPPLVITYSQQAGRKQLAEYLQQSWSQAFGIPVRVEGQEWNILRCNLEKGDYVISGAFEAAFYKDPMEILEKLSALTNNNFPKWTSAAFNAAVASAKLEADPQKRMQLLSQAETVLMQEMPFIPICSDRLLFSHTPGLKGYAFDYVGAIDFSKASFQQL